MLLGAWLEVKNALILLLKNHRKVVEDERVGWFFHEHKLQAEKPHDNLLLMMNVGSPTRSTCLVNAYSLND